MWNKSTYVELTAFKHMKTHLVSINMKQLHKPYSKHVETTYMKTNCNWELGGLPGPHAFLEGVAPRTSRPPFL